MKHTITITGDLLTLSREEAETLLTQAGHSVRSTVTRSNTCIIVGDKPGRKAQQAQALGIPALSLADVMPDYADKVLALRKARLLQRRRDEVKAARELIARWEAMPLDEEPTPDTPAVQPVTIYVAGTKAVIHIKA